MMRWIVRGAAALAALIVIVALVGAGWLTSRFVLTQPTVQGRVAAEGLPGGARIVRDAHGVAHVFGETDADVYFALGYAHAQDRFFQMDLVRRYAQGRLSELFGERTLRVDARARILNFPAVAEAALANTSDETRAAIEAYAAGVNARLAKGAPGPEYALLRAPAEPWRPVDSAALTVYLADDLAAGARDERERAVLDDVLGPEALAEFLTGFPDWAPTTLKDADLAGRASDGAAPAGARAEADNQPGSNAWVVSAERSETGAPLLANDPHLGLAAPSIWYLARLNLQDGPVVGATTPGAPMVLLGRNAHGAWGFTNTGFDVIDLVARDRAGLAYDERLERIAVRGRRAPVEIVVRDTAEGPVLDPEWIALDGFDPEAAIVWRATVDDPRNGVIEAGMAIMKARGFDDFVEAGRGWTAPMQNMHWAGVDGTIGYTTAGLLPIRDPETGEWTGYVPFDDLPRVADPQGGLIASGNNLVAGSAYPYPLPGDYAVYRAPRIETLLDARERHDLDSFAAIQLDVTSELARRVKPALMAARPETQLGVEALARLEPWDGSLDVDGPEGLIYAAWMRTLAASVYADELGEAFPAFFSARRAFMESVLNGSASRWCDDVRTAEPESCAVTAGRALDAAMAETAAVHGEDLAAWRWGEVHQAVFDHPLGAVPLAGGLFEVRAPTGGDGSTVNVAHFRYGSDTYDVYHGASLRALYDLADLDRSRFMHAPGQSGHPLSRHYDDLAPLWAEGRFIEIRADWGPEAPPPGARTLTLVPR